jgi:hypothetical protein
MNEHIEKFARECGAWNQVYGNRMFMIDEHFDIEKFAELIVRECAEVAHCNFHVDGLTLGNIMKEHFGVEE